MKNTYTDGWIAKDYAEGLAIADNTTLTDDQKRLFVAVSASAASKTLTLGYDAGAVAIVVNTGASNAITVKNVAGDTGTSLAAGKAILIVASATADASTVVALN